jgi:hypothetical protein
MVWGPSCFSSIRCADQGFIAAERCQLHMNGRQPGWVRSGEHLQSRKVSKSPASAAKKETPHPLTRLIAAPTQPPT